MQQSSFLGKLLFSWAVLTLVLVGVYDFLPKKIWNWIPGENLPLYVYADDIFGGASYAERASADAIHMRCKLKEASVDLEPFCGFHVYLDNSGSPPVVDMRQYKTMYVDLEYTGDNEKLRFYIRDFEHGFSNPLDAAETSKYMSVYIPADDTDETLAISMDEFTVADWWVNNHNVPRQYAMADLGNVVVFGIDIAFPAVMGRHEIHLKRVTFEGDWVSAEDWYLGILMSWVGIIFAGGAFSLYRFRRITSRLAREKAQYQELSRVDQLTGLMNRHGLMRYCQEELVSRPDDQPLSVMFIDIDHFKPINDNYGHGVGDLILQRVARCIADHCRETDKAARWGGEEFLVLMPGSNTKVALIVAERLRGSVEQLVHPELPSVTVTVSIGVGESGPDETLEQTLEHADGAMYRAKEAGRNRVSL